MSQPFDRRKFLAGGAALASGVAVASGASGLLAGPAGAVITNGPGLNGITTAKPAAAAP